MSRQALFQAPEGQEPPAEPKKEMTFDEERAAIIEKIKANAPEPDEPIEGEEPEAPAALEPDNPAAQPATPEPQQPAQPAAQAPEPDNPAARMTPEQLADLSKRHVQGMGNVVLTPEELAAKIAEAKGPQAPPDPLAGVPQIQMPPEAAQWDYDTQVRYMGHQLMQQMVPGMIDEALKRQKAEIDAQYAPIVQQVQAQANDRVFKEAGVGMATDHGNPAAAPDVEAYLRGIAQRSPNLLTMYGQGDPVVVEMLDAQVKNIVAAKAKADVDAGARPVPPSDDVTEAPQPPEAAGAFKVDRKRASKSALGEMGIDLAEFEKKVNKSLKDLQ